MIAAIVTALVALAVVALVAWPLVTGRADQPVLPAAPDPARVELDDQIEASLRAIREIEFDHQAGNISDEDFAALDRAERATAARLIRRRDQMNQVS